MDAHRTGRREIAVRRPLRRTRLLYLLPLLIAAPGVPLFVITMHGPLGRHGFGAGAVTALALLLMIGVPLLMGRLLGGWLRRPVALVAEDGRVRLNGSILPFGKGAIDVTMRELRTRHGRTWVYDVGHSYGGRRIEIYRDCEQPVQVREWAEAVCRLGEWALAWNGPDGYELRQADELDKPLTWRLKSDPPQPAPTGRAAGAELEPLEGGPGFMVRPEAPGMQSVGVVLAVAWGLGLLFGLLEAPADDVLGTVLRVEAVATALALSYLVWLAAVRDRLVVTPGALVLRLEVLGRAIHERRVPASKLESIYVEPRRSVRLVLAGDGFHLRVGRFDDVASALVVRWAIHEVLRGARPDLSARGGPTARAGTPTVS